MIIIKQLKKEYHDGASKRQQALQIESLRICEGQQWVITGPSGSGKSTLLHCLAGIIRPTEGDIWAGPFHISHMTEQELAKWRGEYIGYMFQQFNLLPALTVEENIRAGLYFSGKEIPNVSGVISQLLEAVGLDDYEDRYPGQLSVGEQQRVAAVRAVIKEPQIILADEPTASLDEQNSRMVMELLRRYSREHEAVLLVASHDKAVMKEFSLALHLEKGRMTHAD